jgi:X-Pro dipeptidyl-peptidase (S15 family)
MRFRGIPLLFLTLLALPGQTSAQQAAGASGKKPESKLDIRSAPTLEKENWGVLDDLKTGLMLPAYSEVERDEHPEFVRQLVRVEWRIHDPIELWIARPKVSGKVPVVLYLYSYADNGDRFRDNGWCKRATADGFAAVGFVSALTDYRYRFRPFKEWFVSELAESLGSTAHDVQLVLNYLAVRGDMDMDQVGMFGMGSGASIAILAAHTDARIKTLDLLDPWGDWPDWLKESPVIPGEERPKYLTPEFLKSVAALDPVAYLPTLKTPHLRLQQTLSEPATPKAAKERLAATAPDPSQVVKYENPNELLKTWQTTGLSGWIKQQLRPQTPKDSRDDARVAPSGIGLTETGSAR